MARVLVMVPTFESIMPDTFKAIWDMDKGGHEVDWDFMRGYDTASARNNIAQAALDGGYDYVMMVDNDVTVPEDALVNLISHDVDVVSGFYAHRDRNNVFSGRTCVCRLLQPDGEPYFNYPAESEYTADEMREMRERGEHLVQVHGGGMGCVLIKTSVFATLDYPWYDWVNYPDDNRGLLSEDLYFCEKMKWKRMPVHVDTRVACGHMFRRIERVD